MHKNLRLAYITTKSKAEALEIGREIIGKKLASCVNIIPKMTSIYRWEGQVQEDSETILIAKTHSSKIPYLTKFVKKMHSYECPCIISISITENEGNEEYLKWLFNESITQP